MTLSPGSLLGPYEVLAPLGAGGMGEVYRARDTRLDRTVAIKILPAHLSDKPMAGERFEREARAISALNHPNICHLYDVGSQDGLRFLVMEYLEGETLADRLGKGPLPLDQFLRCALELCEGLEAAHRSGVVHRDLKPGNIMLTKAGAKLQDFGLAKPSVAADAGGSRLQTMSRSLTAEGSWVGTFQYMSPEQVEGKDVDGRSDIFSLGAVLYEMLTGRRAFEGKSQLSVASAILEKEPASISEAKPMTPQALDYAIRTCLVKDPEKRWQAVRDLAHLLTWIAQSGTRADAFAPRAGRRKTRERWFFAALAVTAVALLVLGVREAGRTPVEESVIRSYVKPMAGSSLLLSDASGFSLSPDGRTLAYVATTSEKESVLWIRPIDSLRAQPLVGTSGAKYPFWSPDGRFVGFFAGGKLKVIEPSGGPSLTLSDAADGRGATWNRDGVILFAPSVNSPLHRVSASGGSSVPVTTLEPSKNEISHRWPCFLPDGRHFLFLAGSVFTSTENPTNTVQVGSLDSRETRTLLHAHAGACYASGHILFLRQNTLMAQPFDLTRLELAGNAVPVADPVQEAEIFSRGLFSASENGRLAFVEGRAGGERQLVWYDRSGKQIGSVPGNGAYASPRISPDGKRLLFYLDSGGYDIWTYDMVRGVKSPQTFGSASSQGNIFPVWSPDGKRIAFTSYHDGKYFLSEKVSDGSSEAEVLLEGANRYRFPSDWSPDGKSLIYHEGSQGGWSIWVLPLTGDRKPRPFLKNPVSSRDASFSPDSKWVAYCSNESGEYKVYIAPFPGPGGKWLVSSGAGYSPRWRRDGREIFYFTPDNEVMAVDVKPAVNLVEVGTAHPLFETFSYGVFGRFDVTPDGQRFVVPFEAGEPSTAITLVVNWPADLKR